MLLFFNFFVVLFWTRFSLFIALVFLNEIIIILPCSFNWPVLYLFIFFCSFDWPILHLLIFFCSLFWVWVYKLVWDIWYVWEVKIDIFLFYLYICYFFSLYIFFSKLSSGIFYWSFILNINNINSSSWNSF